MLLELGFVLTVGALHVGGILTGRFSSGWQYVSFVLPWVILLYCAVMAPGIYHLEYVLPHHFGLDKSSRRAGLKACITIVLARAFIWVLVIASLTESYDSTDKYWPLSAVLLLLVIALGRNLGLEKFKKTSIGDADDVYDDEDPNKHKVQAIFELADVARLRNLHVHIIEMADESSEFIVGCFTSGRKKVVLISDTMLDALSERELAVVAGHELAHLKRGHCGSEIFGIAIRLGICVLLAYLLMPLLAPDHNDWRQLAGAWPVLGMAIWLGEFALLPVRMASSRRQERRANEEALRTTNDPASFISAMTKLADSNLISGRPTWVEKALLQTHPTLDKIIRQARRYAADHDIELEPQPPRTVLS